jgi:hypothetical protein
VAGEGTQGENGVAGEGVEGTEEGGKKKEEQQQQESLWGYTTMNRLRPPTALPPAPKPPAAKKALRAAAARVPALESSPAPEPAAEPAPAPAAAGPKPQLSPAGVVSEYRTDRGKIELREAVSIGPDGARQLSPISLKEGFRLEQDNNVVHVYNVDFPLWRIVRASTAAPTYFPGDPLLLDGGC